MVPLPQFSEVISRILWPGIKDSQQPPPNCDRTHQTSKGQGCKIARRLKCSEGLRIKYLHWTRRSRRDQGDSYQASYKYTHCRVHATAPIPTTVKFGIDSSPPGRLQPVPSRGTQGERSIQHGIGVPPPLVGRPGASGEFGIYS